MNLRTPLLILLTLVCNAVSQEVPDEGSEAKPSIPIPPGVRVERDVAFLPASRKEKADIYYPDKLALGSRFPAVIVIHGGGFNDGDKARKREVNIAGTLAQHGFVAVSINYKLRRLPGQVTWPQSLIDAKTAIRWLRSEAEKLQIDPDRIGVIGSSAGGNLAMMLALTRPQDGFEPEELYPGVSSEVKCAIDFYGAVDLMNYHDMKMFAKTREEAPELYVKASPVTYVHAAAPPIMIVHGTADQTVPLTQSQALSDALTKVNAKHELVIIPGAPHTFDLQPSQRDLRPLILGFFDQHLGGKTSK